MDSQEKTEKSGKTDRVERTSFAEATFSEAQSAINQRGYRDPKLMNETNAMCDYAMANGMDVPSKIIKMRTLIFSRYEHGLTADEIGDLASIHQELNSIVTPATPQALMLIAEEKKKSGFFSFIGSVPIIRQIILISVLFLFAFILIGQMSVVNEANLEAGILGSSGWQAVAVLGYLVSCAGLGACFTSLFRLNRFVTEATYDSRYDSTYWASILLGVIAGLFISELLYAVLFGSTNAEPESGDMVDMGKPALALLGGFSANMVYNILQRLVESIESLVKGDQASINRATRTAELSQLKQKENGVSMNVASKLLGLDEMISSDPIKAKEQLKSTINDLLKKG